MKAKAKVIVEFRGRKYRLYKECVCKSKRDCSFFVKGVCDTDFQKTLPCDDIAKALYEETDSWHFGGFKEVK